MPKKSKGEKQPTGRPSKFTMELAEKICERMSKGEPLAQICRDDGMPAVRTINDWRAQDAEVSAMFGRARDEGYDAIAQQCLDIADQSEMDTIATEHGDRPNTEWISRSKLRVETRLKLLAKWDPRRYGEKIAIGGADDLPPLSKMADDELMAKIAALQAKGK